MAVLLHGDKISPNLREFFPHGFFGLNLRLEAALQIQYLHLVQLLRSSVLPVLLL